MNGRCHNDPMDFAAEVCDSCGEMFCSNCLVYPRGNSKAPFCTHCAMALSGVRNRRPVKPLPRGEIKKRRKALRAQLAEDDGQPEPTSFMPGGDLIDAPEIEDRRQPDAEDESGGRLGRFFRRKTDVAPPPEPQLEAIAADLPEPTVTVVGAAEPDDLPPAPNMEYLSDPLAVEDEFVPTPPDHSAAAILEQLKEQESAGDDNVWLPPTGDETPTWTLPDVQHQSPLGNNGPWEGVAASPAAAEDTANPSQPEPAPVAAFAEAGAPMFVS